MRLLPHILLKSQGFISDSGGIRGQDLFKTDATERPGYVLANKAATNVKPGGART